MGELRPADKSHEVENVVITCMDHRFQEPIGELLKDEFDIDIKHVDRLAIGGSSMGVVDGSLMPSIQIAYEKHSAKNVWLFDHTDCGGFGGLQAFDNDEAREVQSHFDSLKRAKEAIHKVLPRLVVTTFVIKLDGEAVSPEPSLSGQ